jgi:hypothetical protein
LVKRYWASLVVAVFMAGFLYSAWWLFMDALNAPIFWIKQYTELGFGAFFTILGVVCLAVSLEMALASSDAKASRSLKWLGRLQPKWK